VASGVAADAFYQKGSSMGSLLRILGSLPWPEQTPSNRPPNAWAPIWIQSNGHDGSGEAYVTIACPECLRTFPQAIGGSPGLLRETVCIHCRGSIRFAIVPPADTASVPALQKKIVKMERRPASVAQFCA
jgi:hypothetical protein